MAGFAIPGLGSGGTIDFENLLSQIKKAEQSKLDPYTKKKTGFNNQVSSWGKNLQLAVGAQRQSAKKIGDDGFHGVTIGTNKAFKASATSGASRGFMKSTLSSWRARTKLVPGLRVAAPTILAIKVWISAR